MSDTKALIKYVRDRLEDGPNLTFGKPTVRDLVDALEAAEARAEQAEAQVARLTAERDWLAGRCAEELGFSDSLFKERKATVGEWKEAARKAVAGEG